MPVIHKTVVVPFTSEQMYHLVNDVNAYSQFVPWCISSTALLRTSNKVHGKLTFSHSGIEKSFTTLNRLQPNKMIGLELIDGPFKYLTGFWRFESLDQAHSQIIFGLEFEFSNLFLAKLMTPFFTQIAHKLVDSFVQRAQWIYSHEH